MFLKVVRSLPQGIWQSWVLNNNKQYMFSFRCKNEMARGNDLTFLLTSRQTWTQPVKLELRLTAAWIQNVNIWQTKNYVSAHSGKHALFPSSAEQDPSVRIAYHHCQTPHRGRWIRGNISCDLWHVSVVEFSFLVNNSGCWRAWIDQGRPLFPPDSSFNN